MSITRHLRHRHLFLLSILLPIRDVALESTIEVVHAHARVDDGDDDQDQGDDGENGELLAYGDVPDLLRRLIHPDELEEKVRRCGEEERLPTSRVSIPARFVDGESARNGKEKKREKEAGLR